MIEEAQTSSNMDLFYEASDYVRENHSSMQTCHLLELYGFYKQATCGQCTTTEPRWYNFDAAKKWKSWSKLGCMDQEEAASRYVKYLNEIQPNWKPSEDSNVVVDDDDDEENTRRGHGSRPDSSTYFSTGNAVSTLQRCTNGGENIADELKTIFDWVKENNIDRVKLWAIQMPEEINATDDDGLTVLHWAVDRHLKEITDFLLKATSIDKNAIDNEGQTPLHYASFCEYTDMVEALLNKGASMCIANNEGLLPYEVTEDGNIHTLLYCNKLE